MQASRGVLRRIGQVVLFYLVLLWLGGMLLAGNLACLPLILTPRAFREPVVQRLISGLFGLFLAGATRCGLMRIDLSALDVLNGQQRLVLVANHPSMIDVFLVVSRIRRAVCLMKASIATNVFFGIGAYLAGYVSNRHADTMLRHAALVVEQGSLLLAFPEGTRTTRQPVNSLKPGVALIAKRAAAPLQTILIVTNSAYLSKGWNILRPPRFPVVYRAMLGERFVAGDAVATTTETLQAYFERELTLSIDPQFCL
jgi:1-acyl-sn-glycerol-3-phosphate acyltransferase